MLFIRKENLAAFHGTKAKNESACPCLVQFGWNSLIVFNLVENKSACIFGLTAKHFIFLPVAGIITSSPN